MARHPGNTHVSELCAEYGIEWLRVPRAVDSKAIPTHKVVMFSEFSDPTCYLAALHEIGHCILHVGMPKDEATLAVREAEAWIWALDHALDAPPPSARRFVALAFLTYCDDPTIAAHPEQFRAFAVNDLFDRLAPEFEAIDYGNGEPGIDTFAWPR